MTGFIYKWTNSINGMWYIGSRKGTINDGYIGSGKYFLRAVEKYGIENFTREILFEGDYEKDMIREEVEAQWLRESNAARNPMSYNRSNITGANCWSKESNDKRSKSLTGRIITDEHRRKISQTMSGRTYEEIFGIEKAQELRETHSKNFKELHKKWNRKGKYGWFTDGNKDYLIKINEAQKEWKRGRSYGVFFSKENKKEKNID